MVVLSVGDAEWHEPVFLSAHTGNGDSGFVHCTLFSHTMGEAPAPSLLPQLAAPTAHTISSSAQHRWPSPNAFRSLTSIEFT